MKNRVCKGAAGAVFTTAIVAETRRELGLLELQSKKVIRSQLVVGSHIVVGDAGTSCLWDSQIS